MLSRNYHSCKLLFQAAIISVLFLFNPASGFAAETIESLKGRDFFAGLGGSALKGAVENSGAVLAAPEPAFFEPDNTASVFSSGDLRAYFVSVGQGDCQYIELPGGKNALIDGGPANPSGSGDPLVAQFLKERNITKIDYVVLSHPHSDHYIGLDYVFSHIKVGNFYDTMIDNTGSDTVKKLRAKVLAMGVNVSHPKEGDYLPWGSDDVKVKVLHTCATPGQGGTGAVLNNCSMVLRLAYQNTSILFTGDIQTDAEAELVGKYGSELRSDVLKVAHHGSANSSIAAFLKAVSPRFAYIEVGQGNSYGHPTQAALSRLTAAGALVYRTDQGGTQQYVAQPAPYQEEEAEARSAVYTAGGGNYNWSGPY